MTLDGFATALAAFALAPALAISHPLDGLTGAEMERVTEILRAAGEADDQTRYPLIELIEPPKADVLAWSEGDPEPRRARVHFLGDTGFRTAVVDIKRGAVETAGPAAGPPMVLFEEFTGAMRAALEHPGDDRRAGKARPDARRRFLPAAHRRQLPDTGVRGQAPEDVPGRRRADRPDQVAQRSWARCDRNAALQPNRSLAGREPAMVQAAWRKLCTAERRASG